MNSLNDRVLACVLGDTCKNLRWLLKCNFTKRGVWIKRISTDPKIVITYFQDWVIRSRTGKTITLFECLSYGELTR